MPTLETILILFCRWIQMARRILSSSSRNQNSAGNSSTPGPQVAQHQPSPPQSSWRSTIYPSSRIAPAASMTASRSEANLPVAASSLRLPDGGHHPSLDHYGGRQDSTNGNNHLTMLKTKVWYHSQRNVQEASVWKFMLFLSPSILIDEIYIPEICSFLKIKKAERIFIDTIDHRCQIHSERFLVCSSMIFFVHCVWKIWKVIKLFLNGGILLVIHRYYKEEGKKYFIQKCKLYLLNLSWVHFFPKAKPDWNLYINLKGKDIIMEILS